MGWEPYHVRAGYGTDESTITLSSALAWGNNMTPSTANPLKIAELMAWDITERCQFALGSGNQFSHRTVLMTEPVASVLAKEYMSPDGLEADLLGLARRPLKERVFAKYYASPGSAKEGGGHSIRKYSGYIRRTEGAAMTPAAPWRDFPDAEQMTVPVMRSGMTDFLITGDSARNKIQIMPGAGLGGGSVTVKIELPANWDRLISGRGYKPLSDSMLGTAPPGGSAASGQN